MNSYFLSPYMRLERIQENTSSKFCKAELMNFVAEFINFPISSVNIDFLKYCFEQNIN